MRIVTWERKGELGREALTRPSPASLGLGTLSQVWERGLGACAEADLSYSPPPDLGEGGRSQAAG
jgi:hypothetical protein